MTLNCLEMWFYRYQKGKKEKSEQNRGKKNQLEMLHSHDVRSLFFVFSVPLRASTICPEYLIQAYVRRPGNLKENTGACQQPMILSITFTILLHVHHTGCKEKPNHPIQFFRGLGLGSFREHSLHEFFFF